SARSLVFLWTFPPGGFIVWCSHVSAPAMPHHLLSWESPIMWVDIDQGPYLKAVLLLVGILAGPAPLQAQAENGWIGKGVITQYGTVLQVGNQVVDDEGRGKNLARGKEQAVFRIYKIEQANGPWLWLVAEGSNVKGWAPAANVILFEQAIDYITNQIRANPGGSSNYLRRANVWSERKELEIAIADYNEAIRLDPGFAPAFSNRGVVFLLTGSEKAGDDERKFLELEGWRGEYSQYAVLWGYFGSRRAGKAEVARR